MKKYIIAILLFCLVFNIYALEPQRKKRKQTDVGAVGVVKRKPMIYMDISSKRVEYRTLKTNIDRKIKLGCDTLFLTIFSNTGAAVKCPTFEHLATKDNMFLRTSSLTPKQLSGIIANGGRTNIVVVVNLFNNNANFNAEIGHSLFSNEGMRFFDDYMRCVFYGNNIPTCRINTNCTPREQILFIDPLIKNIHSTGINVILNKF